MQQLECLRILGPQPAAHLPTKEEEEEEEEVLPTKEEECLHGVGHICLLGEFRHRLALLLGSCKEAGEPKKLPPSEQLYNCSTVQLCACEQPTTVRALCTVHCEQLTLRKGMRRLILLRFSATSPTPRAPRRPLFKRMRPRLLTNRDKQTPAV